MKIGIMLRHFEQHGGGVLQYTRTIVSGLLALGTSHEFVLMYRNPDLIGTYGGGDRVREVAVQAPSSLLWDQLAVRWLEEKEKLDVIFNPKYSVPLMAKCPTVFVCHGLDWYIIPWASGWADRLSHRYLMPRYARKAASIIAVSDSARNEAIEFLGASEERVHKIYLGVDEGFGRSMDADTIEKARQTYQLPSRFFLYTGQIVPRKNLGRMIQAYAKVGPELGISLVIAGTPTEGSADELALVDQLGIAEWVVRPGWIDRETLPAFYAQAEAVLLPSLHEACPSPILEGMQTGCPVVTSNRHGAAEVAGKAAILVDPESVESIADGMRRVVADRELRHQLIDAGYDRIHEFSWDRCARETLQMLESVHS